MITPLQTAIDTAKQLSFYEQLELLKTLSQFLPLNQLPTATGKPSLPRIHRIELTADDLSEEDVEQQKQRYLQRVNQLYANIQGWLLEGSLIVTISDFEIEEVLGCYHVPKLSITTGQGERLADFEPAGTSVIGPIGAEGLIMVEGWLNSAYLLYLRRDTYYSSKSSEVEVDGWYWREQRLDTSPHWLDNNWLLELITWVSDYEFHNNGQWIMDNG
jgi:hypothetical protein